MPKVEKPFYRIDEVAAMLCESTRNVYHWVRTGTIVHIHVGKKIKISREEVERILDQGIVTKR